MSNGSEHLPEFERPGTSLAERMLAAAEPLLPVPRPRAEGEMKEWLTIPEAALLVGRDKTNVYAWIRGGRLYARKAADGTMQVKAVDVARVEAIVKRGRPIGSARTH